MQFDGHTEEFRYIDDAIGALIGAIRSISQGDVTGPAGIEMLTMQVEKSFDQLSGSILSGNDQIADAIRELASAIKWVSGHRGN